MFGFSEKILDLDLAVLTSLSGNNDDGDPEDGGWILYF